MKLKIDNDIKHIEIEYCPVMQFCGSNIIEKNRIIEIIRKYFSCSKYMEYEGMLECKISLDNDEIGRKTFELYYVAEAEDLINSIKLNKTSMVAKLVKNYIAEFECQEFMQKIDDELMQICNLINNEISQLGDIQLRYEMSELWDMVQKSSIVPYNYNEYLENKSGNELVNIYLNSLEKSLEIFPERTLVIFRDLDHLVKKSEYCDLVYRMKNISDNYDVHFIISSSIDGYCWLKNRLETGVTVFNDVIYGIPDMYHIKEFIENNYPYNRKLEYDELIEMLQNVIHKIGGKGKLVSISDLVILKLINESLAINECITKSPVEQEISFLLT